MYRSLWLIIGVFITCACIYHKTMYRRINGEYVLLRAVIRYIMLWRFFGPLVSVLHLHA